MENGPFPSLCLAPSPLLHLWLLMASVNYSAILKLLSCIDIRAAEEQGEDEVVGHGKSWLAGVHSAPHLMHPAFCTRRCDSYNGWAVHPLCVSAMGTGGKGTQHQVRALHMGEGSQCCWHL